MVCRLEASDRSSPHSGRGMITGQESCGPSQLGSCIPLCHHVALVSSSLWWSLRFSFFFFLIFKTLTVLRRTGPLSHRQLFKCFPTIRVLGKNTTEVTSPSCHIIWEGTWYHCKVYLDRFLGNVTFLRFLMLPVFSCLCRKWSQSPAYVEGHV